MSNWQIYNNAKEGINAIWSKLWVPNTTTSLSGGPGSFDLIPVCFVTLWKKLTTVTLKWILGMLTIQWVNIIFFDIASVIKPFERCEDQHNTPDLFKDNTGDVVWSEELAGIGTPFKNIDVYLFLNPSWCLYRWLLMNRYCWNKKSKSPVGVALMLLVMQRNGKVKCKRDEKRKIEGWKNTPPHELGHQLEETNREKMEEAANYVWI